MAKSLNRSLGKIFPLLQVCLRCSKVNQEIINWLSQTSVHRRQRLDTLDKALPTDSPLCHGINSPCGPPIHATQLSKWRRRWWWSDEGAVPQKKFDEEKRGNGHNMNLPLNWTCQPHKFPDKNLSDFIEDKGLIIYSNSPVINCCVSVTVNFDVVFLYVLYQSYNCTYFWGAAVFLDA